MFDLFGYFGKQKIKPFGLIMSARLQRRYNQPKPIYKHKQHLKKHLVSNRLKSWGY